MTKRNNKQELSKGNRPPDMHLKKKQVTKIARH